MPGWHQEAPRPTNSEVTINVDGNFMDWSVDILIRNLKASKLHPYLPENLEKLCEEAFSLGQSITFSKEDTSQNNRQDFKQILSALKTLHPDAPLTMDMLKTVCAETKIRSDQTVTNYHKNRWDSLSQLKLDQEVLLLLLIELASYTGLIQAFGPLNKYLFSGPESGLTFTAQDTTKFSDHTQDIILKACVAMSIRHKALEYLQKQQFKTLFSPNEILPSPIYAWIAVLHAPNPPEAKLSEFRKARAACYSLLANQKYAEFLAKVAQMQTTCPGCISIEYLKKAQGI